MPTETVYGLAADVTDATALTRVFAVKGRPAAHPLIVHVSGEAMLGTCVTGVPDGARRLVRAFWPGPLTLVLHRSRLVPDAVTGGRDTVAVRAPDHPLTLEVIERLGRPVAAPSANRFGRVSPTTATDVEESLGEDVDLVLDGGPCRLGVESTIVDLTQDAPLLLRPGGVPVEAVEATLGIPVPADSGLARAPGMLASHYAPVARVVAVEAADARAMLESAAASGEESAVLCPAGTPVPRGLRRLDAGPDDASYAQRLYSLLREADRAGVRRVIAVLPPSVGIGAAVRDRLLKAAAEAT